MTNALMDRIKAHRSAPTVYDPPTFDQMADRIEELERERDAYAEQLMVDANTFSEMHLEIEQLRDKISEMQARINRLTLGGNRR